MVRLFYFIFFAFIFSCTIIEDSDITSQEELDRLIFNSIEIKQETLSGGKTTVATLLYDSIQDFIDPNTGAHITRLIAFSLPSFGNFKIKMKSGITSNMEFFIYYTEDSQPYTLGIFEGTIETGILEELYRFRYDANGRLNKIITRAPHVNLGPATSNDTLIYDANGRLSGITRKYPATSTTSTFTSFNYQTSDNSYKLNQFIFQGMKYEGPCQGGGCGGVWGGNYDVLGSNNFPIGVMNLTTFQREYLSIQDLNNIQSNCGVTGCDAWIDTFYFHPLMILKDQLNAGDDLLFIYMVDWWQPVTTQESPNNEKVTFTFKYGL